MPAEKLNTKIKTGECRFCFPHIFEPARFKNDPDNPLKYSVGLLISKDDEKTLKLLEESFKNAKKNDKAKNGDNKAVQKYPFIKEQSGNQGFLTDCDTDDSYSEIEAYANCYYLTATTNGEKESNGKMIPVKGPGVVMKRDGALVHLDPEMDADEIYGGMYGKVTGNCYAFTGGKGGVAFGLQNVMKTKDGEPFGTVVGSAESDFADEVDEEDWEEDEEL